MKKKIVLFCSTFILCLFLTSCEDFVDDLIGRWIITFRNESDATVMVVASLQREGNKVYPMTNFPESEIDLETFKPNISETSNYECVHEWWRNVDFSRSDSVSIFVISPEVFEHNKWSEIGNKKLFLKKYTFYIKNIPRPVIYPNDYD